MMALLLALFALAGALLFASLLVGGMAVAAVAAPHVHVPEEPARRDDPEPGGA